MWVTVNFEWRRSRSLYASSLLAPLTLGGPDGEGESEGSIVTTVRMMNKVLMLVCDRIGANERREIQRRP